MERFLEENEVPQRFRGIENTLIQYAMFVNTVKYELKEEQVETNTIVSTDFPFANFFDTCLFNFSFSPSFIPFSIPFSIPNLQTHIKLFRLEVYFIN